MYKRCDSMVKGATCVPQSAGFYYDKGRNDVEEDVELSAPEFVTDDDGRQRMLIRSGPAGRTRGPRRSVRNNNVVGGFPWSNRAIQTSNNKLLQSTSLLPLINVKY
ncbi:hypothetical protein EVAR_46295_1 [Eumeta japonica]|uniref:Uncharacterized protein n=1 Tax=Eumeta variegata TaxID=151549 RepID=A0A4C1XZY2_EUMVA|nr:hypothetical protein EVAR_46295_1 [Eumeta japonica]